MTPPPQPRGLGVSPSLLVPVAAGVVAFTVQMLWVRHFYVSVPFWDEWNDLYGFLATWRAGAVTWAGFFAQHMEHRLPVARVFFILVDAVFGEGNQLGLFALHALLMAVIVMIWTYTLRRLGESLWLVAATLVVLLSPSQHENWLWGFQVEFFTLVGPVVAAVCWIALAPRLTWAGVMGCAIACAVSSYSIASGLSSWAAVGLLLALRVCLDKEWSLRGLIGARRETALLLAFLAAGIFVTAAYLRGYEQLHPPGAPGRTLGQMAQWTSMALVFPLIDPLVAGDVPWLPAALALVFAPIAAALVLYARRGDRARLLLTVGLLLMVVGNVAIMALGRSGVVFVASRYGTVCLWTAAVSLLATASLVRASRPRWRGAATAIGLAAALLVSVHLSRYAKFADALTEIQRMHRVWVHDVTAYLSDDSPDRQLPPVSAFPADAITPLLQQRSFLATLPYNLRPPARVRTDGDAWALDAVTPGAGVAGPFTWGSWNGADAHTGTLISAPFRPPGGLTLAVSGYPTRPGNSLAIESAADPNARLVYAGPDPGDRWTEWRIDRAQLPAGAVRVVAIDGRQADGAWLGIRFPADRSAAVRALEALVRYLPWVSALLLALVGGWAYRLRGRAPVADRVVHHREAIPDVRGRPMTPPPPARALGLRPSLLVPLTAAVVAFTVQMLWVRHFYVSVPYWDEWNDLYDFLATWRTGGLTWQGFFAQHMEHRIAAARVFFILVDTIFGEGNQLGLFTLHALLMAAIVMIWVYTLRRLREPLWLVAATLVVLLSPAQHENWLWGFQVEFFTLVGPVLAAVCWIALAPRLTWAGVAGCTIACVVSSYSIGSGLSSWAAVGLLLALRVCLEKGWSLHGLLSARREAAQLLMFLSVGIVVSATYFRDYVTLTPPGAEGRSLAAMAIWTARALVFPMAPAPAAGGFPWLPAAVALVFAPIAAAIVLYVRRGDRARLLLTIGLLLMVAGNVGIMAVGRSGWVFVASRYGTVCLWTSAISLMSMASLMRAARPRRRWAAIPIGLASAVLLGVHLWRYVTLVPDIEANRRTRMAWEHNMRVYLSDDSPDRQLPGAAAIPFPEAPIKPMLHREQFLATLPYNLRPPVRASAAGDAWSVDGVPPAAGVPELFTWGSWSGADAHTGTLTSMPFRAPRGLTLFVSGYPTRPGNSLAIVSVADPNARLLFSGSDPGDGWTEWRVERAQFPGSLIRVVAVDGRQTDGAWVAIRFPADPSAAVRVLEAVVRHLPWFSGLILALIGGWAWQSKRSPIVRT